MAMPSKTALLGLLAVAGFKHRDKITDFLRDMSSKDEQRRGQVSSAAETPQQKSFLDDIQSSLSSGGIGALVSKGIGDVVGDFINNGRAQTAQSWVGRDQNENVDTATLEATLDRSTLDDLAHQTGLSRQDILTRLATAFPEAVDRLTPNGQVPDEDEAYRTIA